MKANPFSFDVTTVLGTVTEDAASEMTMTQAAFALIGEEANPGTYTFPLPDGNICRVTVEHMPAVTEAEFERMAKA